MRASGLVGVVLVTVFGGGGCEPVASSRSTRQALWEESTSLSADQKALLSALREKSVEPQLFGAQEWTRAQSVLDLHLDLPLEGDPVVAIPAFLERYGALWHLNPNSLSHLHLARASGINAQGCRQYDFQLTRNAAPIYNAQLRFSVDANGTLTRIVGFMDGRRLDVEATRHPRLDSTEALGLVKRQLGLPEVADAPLLLSSTPAWVDGFFLSGEPSLDEAGRETVDPSWIVGEEGSSGSGVFPVNAVLGVLAIAGPSFDDADVLDGPADRCSSGVDAHESGVAWMPLVAVDPATGAPAHVDVSHFGGLRLRGQRAVERAMDFFSLPAARRMYGDNSPWDHLVATEDFRSGTREYVRLEQYVGQRRVEGAYARLEFDQGRLQQVVSRLTVRPIFETAGLATSQTAAQDIASWLRDTLCPPSGDCSHIDTQLPSLKFQEEVVWSTAILDKLDQAASATSELAARFEMGQVGIWYGLHSRTVLNLEDRARQLDAALPNQIWSTGAPRVTRCPTVGGPFREKCERVENVAPLSGPDFRLEIDRDGAEFQPLDARARAGYATTNAIADFIYEKYDFRNILGDGGVSPFNPDAVVDVVIGSLSGDEGNASALVLMERNDPAAENMAIFVGSEVWSPDVIAHEYAHHLQTQNYGGLKRLEQGALQEAISDLFGAAVFPAPDGSWRIASTSPSGAVRNMKDPRDGLVPTGATAVDVYQDKGRCDPRNTVAGCAYEWMGIPSKALALLADGLPTSPVLGFGRTATTGLVLEILRSHEKPWKLDPADRFLSFRLKLERACRESTRDPVVAARWAGSRAITVSDCSLIGAAFDAVGVGAGYSSGFSRSGSFAQGATTTTVYSGRRLFNGCTIAGHTLHAELRSDATVDLRTRSGTDTPPLFIDVSGGEVVAWVSERCGSSTISASCPDNQNRQVTYNVESKWDDSLRVWTDEQLNIPPGLGVDDCLTPSSSAGARVERLHSSPIFPVISVGPFGRRADLALRPNLDANGGFAPAPCPLLQVGGVEGHRARQHFPGSYEQPDDPLTARFHHGAHGFSATQRGSSASDYAVDLHAWTNGFSGIYARVVYEVERPFGVLDCTFSNGSAAVVRP